MAESEKGSASAQPDPVFARKQSSKNDENFPAQDGKFRVLRASPASTQSKDSNILPKYLFPGEDRSLSGIALRAFLLGVNAAGGLLLSLTLVYFQNRLWRPAFFIGTLCIFHFLEFWTTARYNTPSAKTGSFLLTNGSQYRRAHSLALVETLITSYFFPGWQARVNPPWIIALGIVLILVGQVARSLAMVQAGTNFNHQVQSRKNEGHELVKDGLYAYFRHPSYFGFFWWGLGTQIALGNTFSFIAYSAILWYFFKKRITNEEIYLVSFFGKDYEDYRARTPVWIPFI
ncbi:prenyl cysteine carboxyl methyltransferase-like protein Ste14 [Dendryphion nanum]|uniref:Protein-S-isoprenylcysteine O-methyltransferase n=1 Tax=Dendryphion nanum TaxID=256645 RepID=A0A9P9DFA4_9PLEO|nr:prenyl cysteine carboxyl methyltransferase-like protein Ste14 [Dendryphion nanum]